MELKFLAAHVTEKDMRAFFDIVLAKAAENDMTPDKMFQECLIEFAQKQQ